LIKREKDKYVLYNKEGKRLFSSESYAACVNREQVIEEYKKKAREKRKNK
jgi:hypothetical protein